MYSIKPNSGAGRDLSIIYRAIQEKSRGAKSRKWDGTGYPLGLKGEDIPLPARIFAVVDVWDALTSERPFRQAWTSEKTREYIQSISGTHLDPRIVALFFNLLDAGSE